jgi:hypothetical protein
MILTIAPGASPALVRLVQHEAVLRRRCDTAEYMEDNPVFDLWRAALAAVAGFRVQSAADVALKLRTAIAWDGDIRETAENGCNSAMAIVAALADLDRLAVAKVTA